MSRAGPVLIGQTWPDPIDQVQPLRFVIMFFSKVLNRDRTISLSQPIPILIPIPYFLPILKPVTDTDTRYLGGLRKYKCTVRWLRVRKYFNPPIIHMETYVNLAISYRTFNDKWFNRIKKKLSVRVYPYPIKINLKLMNSLIWIMKLSFSRFWRRITINLPFNTLPLWMFAFMQLFMRTITKN